MTTKKNSAGRARTPRKKPSTWSVFSRYANRVSDLNIRLLDRKYVVIEGKAETLKFLGNLLLAAAEEEDCGTQLSPKGPKTGFFDPASRYGLYLHRLPCVNEELKIVESPRKT